MEPEKHIVDIVMTTWKREWMTYLAIQALRKNTQTPYRLILIDNGSRFDAQRDYAKLADIYVKLDRNYGLEYAKNLGMKFVESPYFVSTDNDVLAYTYTPDWLSLIIDLMEKNPEYVAIAPRPQILVATGMYMFDTPESIVPFDHVPGYLRVMKSSWIKNLGAWNETRPGRGHEEMWIGQKITEHGMKMGWANNIRCWHLFGKEDTDEWGYPKSMLPSQHGHQPVWPMPTNDKEEIRKGTGIEIG